MRRTLGLILTGLGAFLLVAGLMFRFYLPGQVIKDPLNFTQTVTWTGQNATCLDPQTGAEVPNATATGTLSLIGDVNAGTPSTAVWNSVSGVFCATPAQPKFALKYITQRSAFNRTTAQLVNGFGSEVTSETGTVMRPDQTGIVGWTFPINTAKQTYQVFNQTLMRATPAVYTGTTTVDGVTAYQFTQHIATTQFDVKSVPDSVAGLTGAGEVTLPEYLTATYVYDVDPTTGVPLQNEQTVNESLKDNGATVTTLFNGTVSFSPATLTTVANYASSQRNKINLIKATLPLVGLIAGVVLLILGGLLLAVSGSNLPEPGESEGNEGLGVFSGAAPTEAIPVQAEAVPAQAGSPAEPATAEVETPTAIRFAHDQTNAESADAESADAD
jgi:hypothetical protein